MALFEITTDPIAADAVAGKVKRPEAGAVVTFSGTVREWTNDRRTLKLEYEAYHSMAVKQMERIGQEVQDRWPDTRTAITHRVGELHITETAVVIAVSSPHRRSAYEANEYIIERIKELVPIWKKEYWEDGTAWVGDQLETHPYSKGGPPLHD
ncbi:molybdenum cofactor biosynthesis protein MoaE [Salibacterium lacus]|uniref:Molybdenum cofactor biosynthesis protein MoaE n=1 Tax=Salibacterium lacus TaxID=1898109 RepID=A0ABW5T3B7_9BACI